MFLLVPQLEKHENISTFLLILQIVLQLYFKRNEL